MNRKYIGVVLAAILVIPGCFGVPLKDYAPLSPQEAQIKNLLEKYEDCWNRKDTDCIKTLFTKDAQLLVGGTRRGRVLSVNQIPKDLLPLVIEKVGRKKYRILEIEIIGNKAHVTSFVSISHIPSSWLEQDLFLVFSEEAGGWLIKKQSHNIHEEKSTHSFVDRVKDVPIDFSRHQIID